MTGKFPTDIPKKKALKVLSHLGFNVIRDKEHIALIRKNVDGTSTPMTIPNHRFIKGSTLRAACQQAGISREEFLRAYEEN